jgi:hypothetical protein
VLATIHLVLRFILTSSSFRLLVAIPLPDGPAPGA